MEDVAFPGIMPEGGGPENRNCISSRVISKTALVSYDDTADSHEMSAAARVQNGPRTVKSQQIRLAGLKTASIQMAL